MRDIHAELEQWDYDAPTTWEPSSGDILIGVVKGCSSRGSENAVETLTVQEEETGLLVAVLLDAPDLANLIRLQRPHAGERIGIKCVSSRAKDPSRFILMVDRDQIGEQPLPIPTGEDAPEAAELHDDDVEGATYEERSFIEQALHEDDPPNPEFASQEDDGALREIIRRQDEQIAQQARSITELESIITSAIPLLCNSAGPEASAKADEPPANNGMSKFALAITFVSSLSLALACYIAYLLLSAHV